MKILSHHCIQLDPVPTDNLIELKKEFRLELDLANEIMKIEKRDRTGKPIQETRFGERDPLKAAKAHSLLPNRHLLELIRSRFNAIMSCGNVSSHEDKHMGGWTWLTCLSHENTTGRFFMWPKHEPIERASLVLPVWPGTSFCFDSKIPHGFDLDTENKPRVQFLSLIVTKDSVMEILESKRPVRRF